MRIGMAIGETDRGGKTTSEVRHYILSQKMSDEEFAAAVRSHWTVENSCHWSLDVTFREDESRIRERVLANNINWLYRFTPSILKQHPDRRRSLMMRRRCCGWNEKFLMEVINALAC